FQQLLLQLEVRDLELQYDKQDLTDITAAKKLFGAALSSWAPLLASRTNDLDAWSISNPLLITKAFDDAFPSQDLGTNAAPRGGAVPRARSADDIDMDIAIARHAREVTSALEVPECCHSHSLRPQRWDLLWLLQGAGERRIDQVLFVTTY